MWQQKSKWSFQYCWQLTKSDPIPLCNYQIIYSSYLQAFLEWSPYGIVSYPFYPVLLDVLLERCQTEASVEVLCELLLLDSLVSNFACLNRTIYSLDVPSWMLLYTETLTRDNDHYYRPTTCSPTIDLNFFSHLFKRFTLTRHWITKQTTKHTSSHMSIYMH